MKTSNQYIYRSFKNYKKAKSDEFLLKDGNRADALILKRNQGKELKSADQRVEVSGRPLTVVSTILSDKLIDRLNPDNIDSSYFWKKATEVFPLASVVYSPKCNEVSSLNKESITSIHSSSGALPILEGALDKNPDAKILEIGPGYGCILSHMVDSGYKIDNYYAIDVNPLFKFSRLYKTDGKTIPDTVPGNLDVVYSVNVFQHLSLFQRDSYYAQIEKLLVPGGKFIFSMFVVDAENEHILVGKKGDTYFRLWGLKDDKGVYYAGFFGQFTACNRLEEVEQIFSGYNMDLEIIEKNHNSFTFCATKK